VRIKSALSAQIGAKCRMSARPRRLLMHVDIIRRKVGVAKGLNANPCSVAKRILSLRNLRLSFEYIDSRKNERRHKRKEQGNKRQRLSLMGGHPPLVFRLHVYVSHFLWIEGA
jgi:hypothetical protein